VTCGLGLSAIWTAAVIYGITSLILDAF